MTFIKTLIYKLLNKQISNIYNKRFDKHNNTTKGVFWNSKLSQDLRLNIILDKILKIAKSEEFSIADVGCGYGRLYEIIIERNLDNKVQYYGFDINQRLINFCKNNKDFDNVIKMIKGVNELGLEVCSTLGMATEEQITRMKNAGLHAYNHNIDTSKEYYSNIISTHTHEDRMKTLKNIRNAGVTICSGGIIGMGETDQDRIEMLYSLATLKKHPESVPINSLVSIKGTPLEDKEEVNTWDMIRMISTSRIIMPKSIIRLSAGRLSMSDEAQALCFLAGANSIFSGEKLLTTPNPSSNKDKELFKILGLKPKLSKKTNLN